MLKGNKQVAEGYVQCYSADKNFKNLQRNTLHVLWMYTYIA